MMHVCHEFKKDLIVIVTWWPRSVRKKRHLDLFPGVFFVCEKMNKLKNDIMNTETKGAWKIG